MKTVLITGDENAVPAEYLNPIREAGIELACRKCHSPEEVEAFAKDADLVWMFGPNPGLTGDVLKKLPKCKGIFRSGSGLDALPCAAAKELGIEVMNTPESIAESVAEHAVSLLFALIRARHCRNLFLFLAMFALLFHAGTALCAGILIAVLCVLALRDLIRFRRAGETLAVPFLSRS